MNIKSDALQESNNVSIFYISFFLVRDFVEQDIIQINTIKPK
jgi:hypothetical protein